MKYRHINTDAQVRSAKPPAKGQIDIPVARYPGLYLRLSCTDTRTWVHIYRWQGKQKRQTFGRYPRLVLAKARDQYNEARAKLDKGEDPAAATAAPPAADLLCDVVADWLKRDQGDNRTHDEVKRIMHKEVLPALGQQRIAEITFHQIKDLIDAIADRGTVTAARRCHARLQRLFNWAVKRRIIGVSPMLDLPKPGAEVKRKRLLLDGEIRDVWRALEAAKVPACFPAFIRMLLLTAARRDEVACMSWREVDGDVWTIPAERGEQQGHKTGDETGDKVVPLTPAVLALLGKPKKGYVISTTGGEKAFSGFSKAKAALDEKITELRKADGREPMPHWQIHDLRRTARTLMSRAGVPWDIGERVVGHVIPGARGIYDLHDFVPQMRGALEKLAGVIDEIVTSNPPDVGGEVRRHDCASNLQADLEKAGA